MIWGHFELILGASKHNSRFIFMNKIELGVDEGFQLNRKSVAN